MKVLKVRARMGKRGRLRLPALPLPEGAEVEVLILEQDSSSDDLLESAESSLSFWDNPIDDEVWNNA